MMEEIEEEERAKERKATDELGKDPLDPTDDAVTAGQDGARIIDLAARRDGSGTSVVEPAPQGDDAEGEEDEGDSLAWWQLGIAFLFAIGFSIALFKLGPAFLADQVLNVPRDSNWFVFIEAGIKICVFILYLTVIGLMPDMKRVFQYHSAEHKAINAWENGVALEPDKVNLQSRIHVRCGTAFMLWVFVVAVFVMSMYKEIIDPSNTLVFYGGRVLLLPLIAGLSFELIKFAGQHPNNRVLRGIMAPGLWMQYLTTRECDEGQCEVAIKSLEVVIKREFPEATPEEALVELTGDDDEAMQVRA
jgi:uncharacterized protein YqhQ